MNQLQSHTESLVANLQNLENDIKAIKTKHPHNYENVSSDEKMFKSATVLNSDDLLAIFEFLNVEPHCEHLKFYGKEGALEIPAECKTRNESKTYCNRSNFHAS